MSQTPYKPQHDECKDDEPDRNVEGHGSARLRAAVNVRHQPTDQVLHEQERNDRPVEDFSGRTMLRRGFVGINSAKEKCGLDHVLNYPSRAMDAGQEVVNKMITAYQAPVSPYGAKAIVN
jgi:hypothetical protein